MWPSVKLLLEFVSPFSKLVDVLKHSRLSFNEVLLKRPTDMARQDSLSKFSNISLSGQRQLVVLGIGGRIATNILFKLACIKH